ncbi:unnamed protein product [Soboliphyme baturini]|uniref:Secreted protein n=1 Tax=Soboliphyme baturini TaxID=241478 RepID=A0A183J1N8_9BILA|nr:unnamed protein product [Soboliphyme baturini]
MFALLFGAQWPCVVVADGQPTSNQQNDGHCCVADDSELLDIEIPIAILKLPELRPNPDTGRTVVVVGVSSSTDFRANCTMAAADSVDDRNRTAVEPSLGRLFAQRLITRLDRRSTEGRCGRGKAFLLS